MNSNALEFYKLNKLTEVQKFLLVAFRRRSLVRRIVDPVTWVLFPSRYWGSRFLDTEFGEQSGYCTLFFGLVAKEKSIALIIFIFIGFLFVLGFYFLYVIFLYEFD